MQRCRTGTVTRAGDSLIEGTTGKPAVAAEISMESLILAQDERWRRA